MKTILFTIDSNNTNNARQLCENQNGKVYRRIQDFIDTLLQYELIKDESEVVIYEVWEFIEEFNTFPTGKIDKDTMNDSYMGHILIS